MDHTKPWAVYAKPVMKAADVKEGVWQRLSSHDEKKDAESAAVLHEIKHVSEWAFAGVNVGAWLRYNP